MLTDAALKRLQPRTTPYRVQDECGIPGFGIQVTPAGGKGYFLRYTVPGSGGKRRYLALGHWPQTPLAAAREKARAALTLLDQGLDPQALPEPEPVAVLGTFGALIDAWLVHQADRGRRRLADTERLVRGNLSADLLTKPAQTVTSVDIRSVLAAIHQRGARVLANRVRAHLHAVFAYGLQADHDPRRLADPVLFGIVSNPVAAIPRDAGAERAGERALSWAEIAGLWDADAAALSWLARQGLRLLLVTGARVNEVIQAPWREFDLDAGLWTLPATRAKNRREQLWPIVPLMAGLLRELRELYPGDWLFPQRNQAGAGRPWDMGSMGHACRRAALALAIPPFTARDVRRSWKTMAGEAGLSLEIRNRIQGHALQDVGSRHYDRHSYLPEKRAALETWCGYLTERLSKPPQ